MSLDLTQKQLAERCGLALGTIQQYEAGKRFPKELRKISEALECEEAFLLGAVKLLNNTTNINCDENEIVLIGNFRKLNDEGKEQAMQQVYNLTKIEDYTI